MMRARARGRATDVWTDPTRLRWTVAMPLLALIAALGVTMLVATNRDRQHQLANEQAQMAAHQEFAIELDGATNYVASEVDRLTELMMGIIAFNAASPQPPALTVDAYLDLTRASDRFPSLLEARVVTAAPAPADRPEPSEEPSEAGTDVVGLVLELPDSFVDPDQVIDTEAVDPEAAAPDALDAELRADLRARRDNAPFLSTHQLRGQDTTVVIFALPDRYGPQSWAALVFASESFLDRAISSDARLGLTLINTEVRTEDYERPDDLIDDLRMTDDGRLTADAPIDVFGTMFLVRSVSSPDFIRAPDGENVWYFVIGGGLTSFLLYVALRSLVQSRARAFASAQFANKQRAALDRRFRASFELAPIGMAELDSAGRIVEVNPALCDQVGQFRETILGRPLSMLVHEAERDGHIARIESLLNGTRDAAEGEHRFHRPDGRDTWVHESVSVISGEPGELRSLLVQAQDITARRQAAWELAQQALHDDLTGLPNRALFLNRLKHALVRAAREDSRVAVMFIDIDRFKVVNDSLGHDMGDTFLIQIAERIGTALRVGDTVARFGGDEFVVLCETVSGESEASAVASRIQAAFATPFTLADTQTYATASIGITLSTAGDDSADALLRDADAAMYRAKEQGRNRTEVFDQSMRSSMLARMEIESQLRSALENGEIVMHYQAIVDPTTHLPAGYEGLIRWNHPEKGLLGPAAFLPVAEEAGLIHLVDSFALRATCEQIAAWASEYPAARNLYVSTNWSARHLGRFVQQVEQVLTETGINPAQLVIEVTEGFLLEDSEASLFALQRLKQLGVQIAIDDFGTGYSSLSYLTQFAVDFLKIDQSFVSRLPEDDASAAVIGAIADMATRLGIKLIAEGVETDEQIEMLSSLGAPGLQGYRFAKPRPAEDIEQHLALRSGLGAGVAHDADLLVSATALGS